MKIGISLRNSGPAANRSNFIQCAQGAEAAGFDSLWVFDHVAIPPDDAEGSDGIYYDPLASLCFVAACTERIALGTGVLVLPYRPALPTAKWIATLQALSEGRLLLGAGVGWMPAEFQALGVAREQRGQITDKTLEFLKRCFANDLVTENDQEFLFRPRPAAPPIYIGGGADHAIERALRYGDGWIPIGKGPEAIADNISEYRDRAAELGLATPEIVTFGQLPLNDVDQAQALCATYETAGVTHLVHAVSYQHAAQFLQEVEGLQPLLAALR
ncbi:MAG: TIGR03619 family F420-dependent LLM class oxidoreductase [Gammaproteobacteria bacterium]|nr:TIGR03619 family F420-dependent LLM class oxidoreductase [Gammaproteobacteria bacterium]